MLLSHRTASLVEKSLTGRLALPCLALFGFHVSVFVSSRLRVFASFVFVFSPTLTPWFLPRPRDHPFQDRASSFLSSPVLFMGCICFQTAYRSKLAYSTGHGSCETGSRISLQDRPVSMAASQPASQSYIQTVYVLQHPCFRSEGT